MVEGTPKLRKLDCCFDHLGIKFRWDQIQELKLECSKSKSQIPFWDYFHQAVASTSLVKLTFEWTRTLQPTDMYMPIRCPSVQEFTQSTGEEWPTLLDLLALRKTSIEADIHLPAFTHFIQRCNCALTTLEMSIGFLPWRSSASDLNKLIAGLYAVLPHLVSLTLLLRERMPDPSDNSISSLLPVVSPSTLPSLAVLRVEWRPDYVLDAVAMAAVFLPILTKIIKSHRPALKSVRFGYDGGGRVDWAALETLDAFVDLGPCDEIFRMNCWPYAGLSAREYEYSLVQENSA
ncbi:hypothetical protein CYLTODRAFT_422321 [Cylindrobasidium torrendii FP15055 ss-10]|uniref:Uncharacterized protein n=1 Tax=Cylindrobasidium torrendii FP15055 ss-10 TaxID=1314674 RepID=A0A0D7BBZ9_9AGAR|nr:hypothetical protein CYLTODRAFT_422321 [Cylindrobasidium torrendii FP15055 ss-10]